MSVRVERYQEEDQDCDGCGEEAHHKLMFTGSVICIFLCMVCFAKLNIKMGAYISRQR